MWNPLLAFVLVAPFALQAPTAKPPSAETVKATVAKLETAFKTGKTAERTEAIREASAVLDADVVKWIAKGLSTDDAVVCAGALDALGTMQHPDALAALTDAWTRDRELRKHDELGGRALKAIARHRSPKSIALLADDPFESSNHAAIQARILGLANIREKESVERLIAMMRLVGQNRIGTYMDEFRLALFVLTGHDEGRAAQLWFDWWNEHKKDFAVAKELPELPRLDRMRWNAYWGVEADEKGDRDPPKRKEKRGDEPRRKD
ncbi:MAG: HEAT repeat domain-containing protein [Planctomycetes bacterium]|nr:HEAT repeat domain-containing protein [Planctomycetota bacterium]